jgi:hypothetical protein
MIALQIEPINALRSCCVFGKPAAATKVQNFVVHHLGELLCIRINAIARCIGYPTAHCIRARVNVVNAHVVKYIEFMCLSRRLAVRAREKA